MGGSILCGQHGAAQLLACCVSSVLSQTGCTLIFLVCCSEVQVSFSFDNMRCGTAGSAFSECADNGRFKVVGFGALSRFNGDTFLGTAANEYTTGDRKMVTAANLPRNSGSPDGSFFFGELLCCMAVCRCGGKHCRAFRGMTWDPNDNDC